VFVVTERQQGAGQTFLKLQTGGWVFTHHPTTGAEICTLQSPKKILAKLDYVRTQGYAQYFRAIWRALLNLKGTQEIRIVIFQDMTALRAGAWKVVADELTCLQEDLKNLLTDTTHPGGHSSFQAMKEAQIEIVSTTDELRTHMLWSKSKEPERRHVLVCSSPLQIEALRRQQPQLLTADERSYC
jgi:hypothetical protein